jgi:nucleoside-diphosphate-sugar epimerase
MKVFVTGSTGYIGSRVVAELLEQGHKVVGLCRTAEQAEGLKKLGVEPLIGDVREVEPLEKAAKEADAVLHLAFIHDFAKYEENVAIDKNVINAFHRALKGTGKRVVITSGTLMLGPTEPGKFADDNIDVTAVEIKSNSRGQLEKYALGLAKDGLNISVIRLPGFVYGENGHGFAHLAIQNAKKLGVAYYIGEGSAKFSAVHVRDAAHAYALALTKAQTGAAYNAVSENDATYKQLAEATAKLVGVEAKSASPDQAQQLLGPLLAMVFSINHQAVGIRIEKDLGWKPVVKTTLCDDVSHGSYIAPN